jgi:thiol-disulfide isomerase/thioredoxin
MIAFHHTKHPSYDGATGWINSEPLTPESLQGRVVLTQFWTFTCINWLRTLPHVRAWADAYAGDGLVVVGVHTPEFEFEHDPDRVQHAVEEMRIAYPVALDPDYAVWSAFSNHYWPALYLADRDGVMRFEHFGEGRYEETERVIQQLLGVDRDLVSVVGDGAEAPADWDDLRSPETYLGLERSDRPVDVSPDSLRLNQWTLSGGWTQHAQGAILDEPGGSIAFRFHARDLHLVMGPVADGAEVRFRVLLDGEPAGAARGVDVDEQGVGTATERRMYQLIRQRGRIDDRTFQIEFLDAGVGAYVFTFG